ESSRNHLLGSPELFGINADMATGGQVPDAIEQTATQVAAMPGVAAVGLRQTLSTFKVRGPGGTLEVSPNAIEVVSGDMGSTIIEGRRAASPSEVIAGRGVLQAVGASVGDVVTVEGGADPITLTVVGAAVSWDPDEVDRAFELTPSGLESLAPL